MGRIFSIKYTAYCVFSYLCSENEAFAVIINYELSIMNY